MATICSYPLSQNKFTHWKCALRCWANFPRIDLPIQEVDRHNSNASPTICFHVYHLIPRCKVHGLRSLDDFFVYCYIILLLCHLQTIEKKIYCHYEYIYCWFSHTFLHYSNTKISVHLLPVHILGTHHCGNTQREAFKLHRTYQYFLFRCDYAEIVADKFSH